MVPLYEKQKILVVDDDGIHLEMVEAVLSNGYDVSTAKSGKEALGLFYQGLVPQFSAIIEIITGTRLTKRSTYPASV